MEININGTVVRTFDGWLNIAVLDPRKDPFGSQDVVDAGAIVGLSGAYLHIPACVHPFPAGPKLSHHIGHTTVRGKPVTKPYACGMIIERRSVTGEMPVTVVEWSRAYIYVTNDDDISALVDQFGDALLQHKVIIYFEWQSGIRRFVRAVNVDKDKQAKV